MGNRHIRAVQRRNADYDETEFRIMQVIATDIGEDGSPAYPSYREIAERTGVHYNTVMTYVQRLASDGKVNAEKVGRRIHYTLPFEVEGKPQVVTNDCDNHNQSSQFEARLSQLERQLSQLSSQFEAFIVTMSQTGTVTEVKGSKGKLGEDTYNARANGTGHEVVIDGETEDRHIAMRTAICAAVKTTYVPHLNGEEFDAIADAFVRDGLEPSDVDDFGQWWAENGYYTGKPALKTLAQEIQNSIAGVSARASPPNGQERPSEPKGFAAIRAVMQELDDE